jgi:hypothetical protein
LAWSGTGNLQRWLLCRQSTRVPDALACSQMHHQGLMLPRMIARAASAAAQRNKQLMCPAQCISLFHGTQPHLRTPSTNGCSADCCNLSITNPVFISACFGTDRHAFDLQLLKLPPDDAPLLKRAQDFACFEEIVHQDCSQFTSLTIQKAHGASNAPVGSSPSAAEEANRVGNLLCDAFLSAANLTCLGFFKSDG